MKNLIKLISCILLIFLFSFSVAFSHHGKNGLKIEKKFNIGTEKKDIQNKYCTTNVNLKKKSVSDSAGPPKEEDVKNLEFTTNTWIIKNYHDPKSTPLDKVIRIKELKNKPSTQWRFNAESSLRDILKAHCIHRKGEPISKKLDTNILKQIKEFNGLKGNKITQEIYDNGIKIPEELVGKLVYHTPDYLIQQTEAEKADKEAKRKNEAAKAEENKWVSENKPGIVELAEKKLTEQKDIINSITVKFDGINKDISKLASDYKRIEKSIKKFFEIGSIQNKSDKNISEMYEKLFDLKEEHFPESPVIKKLQGDIKKTRKKIEELSSSNDYVNIYNRLKSIQQSNSKERLQAYKKNIDSPNIDTRSIEKELDKIKQETDEYSKIILDIEQLRTDVIKLDRTVGSGFNYFNFALYLLGFALIVAIGAYVYFQQRKISSLSSATDSAGRKFSELEGQLKSTSERLQSVASSSRSSVDQSKSPAKAIQKPQTPEEIIANKYDDLISDYKDAIDDFSKVVAFKQKWNGLALSRKERQDGTKTILINSPRAFEKSEIWCLNFDNKFFAFPGSTVKSNMAAYMNLDFEKAQRDFKGVFSITSGSNYAAEPSVLRRGGAGFVVERPGKLIFPQ